MEVPRVFDLGILVCFHKDFFNMQRPYLKEDRHAYRQTNGHRYVTGTYR